MAGAAVYLRPWLFVQSSGLGAGVPFPGQKLLEGQALPHEDPAPELLVVPYIGRFLFAVSSRMENKFNDPSIPTVWGLRSLLKPASKKSLQSLQARSSSELDISMSGIEGMRDHTACKADLCLSNTPTCHTWQRVDAAGALLESTWTRVVHEFKRRI